MAIIKCKMCGGDIELSQDKTFGTCEFCGSTMTLPKIDDEQRVAAFNRGNHFRRIGEFDKALAVYERIVAEDNTDAEAHWCCALCRFGIEYVEDPATYEWLPTCHRASFDSFLEDVDYLAAVEYSDGITKREYQKQGTKIADVQHGILATSQKEEPFDVFICYKETDENGERTVDSTLAQDVYYQLTDKGYRVFFSRITLEDKGGAEYEPYIFAALNSAKVMIAIGTKSEHFNAVWVKNEWSRYLSLMKKDRGRLILPCYRDMDPYDLPEQLSVLQSYDMSKIGFIQDLIHGIEKVLSSDKKDEQPKETVVREVVSSSGANADALLKRGYMALEDRNWDGAVEFFDRVLDIDAECAEAYLGCLLSNLRVPSRDYLEKLNAPFDQNNNYKKAYRFGDDELKGFLAGCIKTINNRNEELRIKEIFARATNLMTLDQESGYKEAAASFKSILEYRNSKELYEKCIAKAEEKRKERIYKNACSVLSDSHTWKGKETDIDAFQESIKIFESLGDYKDSKEKIIECNKKIEEIKEAKEKERIAAEEARIEKLRIAEQERIENEIKAKRNRKIAVIGLSAVVAIIVIIIIINAITNAVAVSNAYKAAISLEETGNYESAIAAFAELGNYKDSAERILANKYLIAEKYLSEKELGKAAIAFGKISDYKDARQRSFEVWDKIAVRDTIAAGGFHTVALKADETVVATEYIDDGNPPYKGQCEVSDWTDIIAISAGSSHTVGLKADGTVVATKYTYPEYYEGQCDVSDWTDIVAISAGGSRTIGLKSDGTVVAIGDGAYGSCDVSDWTDIVAVSAGASHTVGLKLDGTVIAVGDEESVKFINDEQVENYDGRCDVSDWTDIVAVSAGSYHTVGLKADGTVVAVGNEESGEHINGKWVEWNDGRCNVSGWKDIVAVFAGNLNTVGLKSDGTMVAIGNNDEGQCNVSGWIDIVHISSRGYYTVGLKKDGTVISTEYLDKYRSNNGQCNVSDWTDIKLPK